VNKVLIALAVSVLACGAVRASDKSDIMAVLNQWNDADEAKSVAACADDAAVTDDVPPFEWHGAGACARWQRDEDAYLQHEGITDAVSTIGDPRQLLISGDGAYAVLPATYAFTQKGKRVHATATATFALHKTASGWRITAWTWARQTIRQSSPR
jgi:ketosteroid isomerase-like protein